MTDLEWLQDVMARISTCADCGENYVESTCPACADDDEADADVCCRCGEQFSPAPPLVLNHGRPDGAVCPKCEAAQ